ncbi:MAG: hypothetical protein Q7J60_04015 [Bradyrhizobium sp.]|uniref:hypothetical protein n=1 Tax=Bradyrhizobium sp. TaxID=376 RepID=UPI002721EFF3|nr:hypothetical protein [Bradyrhizobium sp.]MDO9560764.1 hypothetical protein [Bradyrhizobium sp.]MDP3691853.1 hypothetical protein [Bradyrhizobium sp.]
MREKKIGRPLAISAAVALLSTAAFLIVEFGPRNREAPDRMATKEAAQSAGANVIPTQPELAVEPTPAGPKRIQSFPGGTK